MTQAAQLPFALLVLAIASAGFVFGLAYFAALKRSASLFAYGRSRAAALALTLGRIAAAFLFLSAVARLGAACLLAAFLGFLLARALALRAARRMG